MLLHNTGPIMAARLDETMLAMDPAGQQSKDLP